MKAIPLLIHKCELLMQEHYGIIRDEVVLDDELPAVVNRDVLGYIISRGTRVTEVKRETVDDN